MEVRTQELLEKYPYAAVDIFKALDLYDKIPNLSEQQKRDLLHPEELLQKYTTKIQNQPFDKQKEIHKILIEEMGGEESEYESDLEELSTPESKAGQ